MFELQLQDYTMLTLYFSVFSSFSSTQELSVPLPFQSLQLLTPTIGPEEGVNSNVPPLKHSFTGRVKHTEFHTFSTRSPPLLDKSSLNCFPLTAICIKKLLTFSARVNLRPVSGLFTSVLPSNIGAENNFTVCELK